MQKSYLLLRHNQQSGPYSLEELTCMSLQAKDLIWVIGQSAGWRYPEEIDALKPLVQGRALSPDTITTPALKREQSAFANNPQQPAHTEQPTRHIYVSLPVTATVVAPSAASETETASLSFEERVEKMRQRVAAADRQKATPGELETEIRYSRSLEDIKAEYASWMQVQKNKRKVGVKQVAVAAIVMVAALGVYGMVNQLFFSPADKAIVNNTREPSEEYFYPTVVMPPAPVAHSKTAKRKESTESKKEYVTSRPEVASKKKALPARQAQPDPPAKIPQTAPVAMNDTTVKSPINDHAETTAGKPATVAEQLHINAEYIAGSKNSSGVEGLTVTVKNNSSQMMKVVAVDVVYFADGMSELERKTLYFSNLQPGQALTRTAPAHKKAEGAYAQLGLISSEEGSIFYASNK